MAFRIFISLVVLACGYFAFEAGRLVFLQHSLLSAPDEQSLGNPDGDLVLVKFFEYSCSECRANFPVINQALNQDAQVKFIPRPRRAINGEGINPALVVYAASKHGKFEAMHNALVQNYRIINDNVLADLASDVGLDPAVLAQDIKSKDVQKMAEKNEKLFARYRLVGTPAYAIGKDILFVPQDDLSANEFVTLFQLARGEQ